MASWWKPVEKQPKMARKWWIFLHWYILSNAETYIALANHTKFGESALRFFPPVETGVARLPPLVGELDAPAETRQAASLRDGDSSGIMGVESASSFVR